MKYYLQNKLANNGIDPNLGTDKKVIDAYNMDYNKFFAELNGEDEVVLVGGDGTINYFINHINLDNIKNNVYLFPAGTGNDFMSDVNGKIGEEIPLNKYLVNLPTVYVNGMERKFINGIGYGIDGYCCEVADQIKERTPNAKINYAGIAIKGILGKFNSCHATVICDGKTYEYDNVWLAPSMKGRYYGGGMIISPSQDRNSKTLSVVTYRAKSRLKALAAFPAVFKGEHIKHKNMVEIINGNEIEVKFSRPCALQIDGDTVLNVSAYRVKL